MSRSSTQDSSVEVEHEAEDTRANLAHTLDQLRENLKPENVVDEVMTNAKFGAANLIDGLWKTARENPIPALLIGAGVALILGLGTRRGTPRRSDDGLGSTLPPGGLPRRTSAFGAVADDVRAARDTISDRKDQVSDTWDRLREQTADRIDDGAADTRGGLHRGARPARARVAFRLSLGGLLDERPLILGAAGLAVGAAIGAALPTTRTEEDWLGETSASVKHAAQDAAQAQLSELKAAAGRAVDHVKQSASEHGLSADNLNDLVRDVGTHAKTAVHEIGDSFEAPKRVS